MSSEPSGNPQAIIEFVEKRPFKPRVISTPSAPVRILDPINSNHDTNSTNNAILGDLLWVAKAEVHPGGDSPGWSRWTTSREHPDDVPALDVRIGQGSGQHRSPFSCTHEQFTTTCTEFGFSDDFLTLLSGRKSFLEHRFAFAAAKDDEEQKLQQPTHLEVAAADYEIDSFMCLIRYELGRRGAAGHAKCIIFAKASASQGLRQPVKDITARFERRERVLARHPLLVLNVLLELLQEGAHTYAAWRRNLLRMEAQLGVSHDLAGLERQGYPAVSYDFGKLNADLAGLVKALADNELSVVTIRDHAMELQRLSDLCDTIELQQAGGGRQAVARLDERHELIQSTICRAEVYLKHVNMTKDVLQSLTAVLFNRIDKSDSQSMKTIAVVTLLFLPATFVSSVFSTGIFDFHAGEPADAPRVVSSYGWVYLLVCLLATVLAVLLWTFWYLWGGAWLDGLRRPEQSGGSGGFVTLKTLETSGRTRLPYLGRRKP